VVGGLVTNNAGIITSNSHALISKRKIDERHIAAHHDGVSSSPIIPIILTSDKTLLSHNAKAKAWPLFMIIGSIPDKVRFVPGKHCAQLICMMLVKFGFTLFLNIANGTGIETHQITPVERKWKREVIHQFIRATMSSIESVMETGNYHGLCRRKGTFMLSRYMSTHRRHGGTVANYTEDFTYLSQNVITAVKATKTKR
jgi:Plavaka transposase